MHAFKVLGLKRASILWPTSAEESLHQQKFVVLMPKRTPCLHHAFLFILGEHGAVGVRLQTFFQTVNASVMVYDPCPMKESSPEPT